MIVDLKITGGRTAFLDLLTAQKKMESDIRTAIVSLAREYKGKVAAEFRSAKSGRRYARRDGRATYRRQRVTVTLGNQTKSARLARKVSVATGTYTASAPGQAPAVQTGTMLRSLRTKIGGKRGPFSARVFADRGTAFYRHFLEFGTGKRMIGRGKQISGKSRKQSLRARNTASAGILAPRPVFSPLQTVLNRELTTRVAAAVAGFGR